MQDSTDWDIGNNRNSNRENKKQPFYSLERITTTYYNMFSFSIITYNAEDGT